MLIVAEKEGRTGDVEGLERNIIREGWREHWANLRAADTRAFSNYLAKAEGAVTLSKGIFAQCAISRLPGKPQV